jgi:hypothetical protein
MIAEAGGKIVTGAVVPFSSIRPIIWTAPAKKYKLRRVQRRRRLPICPEIAFCR